MNIYFVRHFKTLGNTQRRYIGRTDEPLFAAEQQPLPQGLPVHPDAIFTSPMLRCLQTKALLYPTLSHTAINDLREMDFGAFEALTYEDLKDNIHYRNFIDGTENALDGEATSTFKERCCGAFSQIVQTKATAQNIVIVCHGGTIMSILERFVTPKKEGGSFYDYQIANGGMLSCYWDGIALTPKPNGN